MRQSALFAMAIGLVLFGHSIASLADDKDAAKRAYVAARVQYDKGNFENALTLFQTAYEAWPDPKILYDIAQCQRLSGRAADALKSLDQFDKSWPGEDSHRQVMQLVRGLQRQVQLSHASSGHCGEQHPLRVAIVLPSRIPAQRLVRATIQANCPAYIAAYYVEGSSAEMLWPSAEEPVPVAAGARPAILPSTREEAAGFRLQAQLESGQTTTQGQLVIFAFARKSDFEKAVRGRPALKAMDAAAKSVGDILCARDEVAYTVVQPE